MLYLVHVVVSVICTPDAITESAHRRFGVPTLNATTSPPSSPFAQKEASVAPAGGIFPAAMPKLFEYVPMFTRLDCHSTAAKPMPTTPESAAGGVYTTFQHFAFAARGAAGDRAPHAVPAVSPTLEIESTSPSYPAAT